MSFDKYKTRGAYHYEWYKTEAWYKACVDKCVEFCQGITLDVGCGDGFVTNAISANGYEAHGIDNNSTGIKLARIMSRRLAPFTTFEIADINKEIDGVWDYMVCLNTIEHLDKPDGILRIFKDNITKAGIIITDVPQEQPSTYHTKEYSPRELADLFKGYKVVPFQIDKDFHGIEVYK